MSLWPCIEESQGHGVPEMIVMISGKYPKTDRRKNGNKFIIATAMAHCEQVDDDSLGSPRVTETERKLYIAGRSGNWKKSSKNWIKRVSLIKYDQNWWLWRYAHELVALMRYWQGSLSSPGDHRHPQKQLHAVTTQARPQLPSLIFTMWLLVFHYPTSKTWKNF